MPLSATLIGEQLELVTDWSEGLSPNGLEKAEWHVTPPMASLRLVRTVQFKITSRRQQCSHSFESALTRAGMGSSVTTATDRYSFSATTARLGKFL
jgi:hypothetical protein